jgi:hypothetical protein
MVKLIKVTVPKTEVEKAAALMADGYRLNSVVEARGRVPEKHIYVKEVTEAPTKKQLKDFADKFRRLGLAEVTLVNVAAPAAVTAAVAAPAFFAPFEGNNLFEPNPNPYGNGTAMNVDDGGGGASARKGRKQRKTRRRRNGGKSRRGRTYNRRS